MRKDKRRNKPTRPAGNTRKSKRAAGKTPSGTSPQYTPQQRETMQQGLRILAVMIARTHLRRQADRGSAGEQTR